MASEETPDDSGERKVVELVSEVEWTVDDGSGGGPVPGHIWIDVHPNQPWVLCSFHLKPTSLEVWRYVNGTRVASWLVPDGRRIFGAKFIPSNNWIVGRRRRSGFVIYKIQGSNLCPLIVLRHALRRRCGLLQFAVHPRLPYILTSFDELAVLWEWKWNWYCECNLYRREWASITFERTSNRFESRKKDKRIHALAFHPTDPNIFATASGGVIDLWDITTRSPMQTIKMMYPNCDNPVYGLDFCSRPGTSYLLSCHDIVSPRENGSLAIWDLENGGAVCSYPTHKFSDDLSHLRTAFFHPSLPYIFTVAFDDIKIWDESNDRLLSCYSFGLRRNGLRGLAPCKTSNHAIAFRGKGKFTLSVVTKTGEDPSQSMTQMTSVTAERRRT
ncbi:hypothetical protein CBR_g32566 [Chara braunii]|uniref:Uncharacterized protein n=1 Tax=Chara braunii TaxID=69332 RepID=A0A388LGX1_CHABU|nr:hypothetical protein CBR_g32566 [Chara braunii]|eukprot:GBG81574.1 hypothetical protein CBR_g32566 [Chara braunii]